MSSHLFVASGLSSDESAPLRDRHGAGFLASPKDDMRPVATSPAGGLVFVTPTMPCFVLRFPSDGPVCFVDSLLDKRRGEVTVAAPTQKVDLVASATLLLNPALGITIALTPSPGASTVCHLKVLL